MNLEPTRRPDRMVGVFWVGHKYRLRDICPVCDNCRMNATTATSARNKMTAKIQARTTDQLLADMAHLATLTSTPETRLVGAAIADVITEREGIDEALDAIFSDDDFDGTYLEAIVIALGQKAAPVPAPPADLVPTHRESDCRYCQRYNRACGRHARDVAARNAAYAVRAAKNFLASMDFYGQTYVPVSAPGGPATPAYLRNMLYKATAMLGGDQAAIDAAREAAIARDGNAFHLWSFYAESVIARFN